MFTMIIGKDGARQTLARILLVFDLGRPMLPTAGVRLDDRDANGRSRRTDNLRLQISILRYGLTVAYIALLLSHYKMGVWAVATYHP
jgi:hypothetical protein